jgi:hypothetical protein
VVKNSSPIALRRLIVLVLLIALFAWTFSAVIFSDRNFVYRDASQFYYPLLKVVQQQWDAGLWPLWNPHENSGMPLLGNPASAVLYPPRIVLFQWLPLSYAAAFKWYTLLHVLLCAWSAWLLARRFELSEFASGLAAITYAFGAAVLFQYCNVIFLVGAAWVPFALLATDRTLSTGDWRWACALGFVLAMQVFGGDPEAAYVSGGLAAIYLALMDSQFALLGVGALALTYIARWSVHGRHVPGIADYVVPGMAENHLLGIAVLALFTVPIVYLWRLRGVSREGQSVEQRSLRVRRRLCLVIAAVVSLGVSAVQWIPSWEFGRISNRAAGGVHYEPYAFWIAPWRFAEFLWPNVMGQEFPVQSRWLNMFRVDDKEWEPSLYFGALAAILAIRAWGVRRVPHWQRWLSLILVFSLWASTGPSGGVSWYQNAIERARQNAAATEPQELGAKPNTQAPGRTAADLLTPAGGLYWVMLELLPGFDTFRYPAKLLTFTAIAFAVLAGAGWDRLFGADVRTRRTITVVTIASLLFAVVAYASRGRIEQYFQESKIAEATMLYGPLVASKAWFCLFRAFATTAVLLALVLVLNRWTRVRPQSEWIPAIALALVAIDIAAANKWMIVTSPQTQIDAVPKLVDIIREAVAADGNDEPEVPMRIHRISSWTPPKWSKRTSPDQPEEIYRWEKDTIQPKHGLPFGINYTINEGTLEPYDYWWFFAPFYSNTTPVKRSEVYYPIRGFDMWGAKYFVLPSGYEPTDQNRGIKTFVRRSTLVAESGVLNEDYQVRRNIGAYPRAWIVHQIQFRPPIEGVEASDKTTRNLRMREILYEGFDGLWREDELDAYVQDPHRVVWIEDPDRATVMSYNDPNADNEADRCRVVHYAPDRVEVEAETSGRGILVLADLLYPGWTVEVDGKPSTILRANRMMRGVPLTPGKHQIDFVFKPLTVRAGAGITLTSMAIILAVFTIAWGRLTGQRQVKNLQQIATDRKVF